MPMNICTACYLPAWKSALSITSVSFANNVCVCLYACVYIRKCLWIYAWLAIYLHEKVHLASRLSLLQINCMHMIRLNLDKTNLDAQKAMTNSRFFTYGPSQNRSAFTQKCFWSRIFSLMSAKMGFPLVFTMTIQSFANNPLGDPSVSWYRHQDFSFVVPRISSVLLYPLHLPNRSQMF